MTTGKNDNEIIRYKRYKIKPSEALWGIRFWGLNRINRSKVTVYEYVGCDDRHKLHFFKGRQNLEICSYHENVLVKSILTPKNVIFRPFLIDYKLVKPLLKKALGIRI